MDANINQDIEIFFMGGDRTIHIEDNGEEPLNAKDIAIEVFDSESIDRYSNTNEGVYMEILMKTSMRRNFRVMRMMIMI